MATLIDGLKDTAHKTLRATERYTRTDMVYLAKGGFWLTLGQTVGTLSGLLVTVVLANLLSEEAYGNYKYILSLYGMVMVLSLSGMTTAITRAVANGKEGVLRRASILSFTWGLAMTAAAAIASGYYFYNHNALLGWSLAVIAIVCPIVQCVSLYQSFASGKKDFQTQAIFSISNSVIPAAILIITAFLTHDILILVAVYLISGTLVHGIHYLIALRKYRPNDIDDPASIGYGKHLSLMSIIGGISFQLDKVLVWAHLGAAPLALYSIATAPPQQLRYLNKMLVAMALPRFSTRTVADLQVSMKRKISVLFCASVALVITYWIAAPFIYEIFFPKYIDAVIYSRVFSLVILFFPSVLMQEALNSQMQKKQLYVIQTVLPAIKILMLVALLPLFGLWGIFIAMFGAELLRTIVVTCFFYTMKSTAA